MVGNAPRFVLWLGILMILVGLTSRYILGVRGVNGFIPLLFGMPIAVLGLMALDPPYRQPTLRWVAGLALLGLILTLNVLPHLQALLRGEQASEQLTTIIISSALLLLSALLLIVCIAALTGTWWQRRRG